MIRQTKFGWVDLSNLVLSNNSFDWDSSIGRIVNFKYDDIVGALTITGRYNSQYMCIDIPEYVTNYPIYVGQIKNGQFGRILKKITPEFKYNIGDIINDLLISDMYKISGYKYYNYRCTKDGYEGHIRESHLATNHGCPVCANKIVLKGHNDIATTNPNLANLFCNKDDAYLYTEFSNKYANFKCPRCGHQVCSKINYIATYGLSCKKCGDGISYPNKFVYNFVEQVSTLHSMRGQQLMFQPEKNFKWSTNVEHENKNLSGRKMYDMYIYDYNIIIENHGNYHYKESYFNKKSNRSLEDVQENDKIKMNLAIENGIQNDHYIVLDCYESNMDYIKNSIMSSNLPTLLHFSEHDIDWNQCDKFATSSRVYEACEHWNNGIKDCKQIASIMKMDKSTIRRYIKNGQKLGIIKN